MTDAPRYVVISPVKDEERYIEGTIGSMLAQSVRPLQWIIVDDGSIDGTRKILERYAREIDWIIVVQRTHRGSRATGSKVIQAFCEGYDALKSDDWQFIVKLDCDLSFGPAYFADLLARFQADSCLGIASGVYLERKQGDLWKEVGMPSYHAAGACKVVRRECYQEIGGFIPAAGWDTVDEIRAIARGWKTSHFRHLQMKHHKAEGSGIGMIRTGMMHGEIFYRTGGDKMFFLLKAVHRIASKPYVIGAAALTWGYLRAALGRKQLLVTPDEALCYQALLRERLWTSARKLVQERRIQTTR
jgi:glycosyltransferase involved in cell wall biosynthesis